MKELEPVFFTEDNYEPDWWGAFEMDVFHAHPTFEGFMNQSLKQAVGYCDADNISYRPKENSYAVMFDAQGKNFWFHIRKVQFDMFLQCTA